MFNFPLTFRFRFLTFSPEISIVDASGAEVCYIRQRMFKLKESIIVYTNSRKETVVGRIEADRIIDFSAKYRFENAVGESFGSVGRSGMRSMWRAHYEVFTPAGATALTIREESVWMRTLDGLVSQIPLLGLFSGLLFHASYAATTADGTVVARLRKRAAVLESQFGLEQVAPMSDEESLRVLFAFLMLTLLERRRG